MNQNSREQISLDWPQPKAFKKSIRLEFSIYVAAFILTIMLITGYVITSRYVGTVTQNVVDNLLFQARSYAGPAGKLILSSAEPDALMLSNLCNKLAQNNIDIYWVGITDVDKIFVAHTEIKQVFIQNSLEIRSQPSNEYDLLESESMAIRGDTIYLTVPIVENAIDIGTIAIASSIRQISEAKSVAIFTVGTITLIMILIGIPLTMIMVNRKLSPISTITDSLKSVDFNEFNFELNIKSKNEFGYLAETLKIMGARIKQARQEALEQDRMNRELVIAKEIQKNILPTGYPRKSSLEFAGVYASANQIGGDYYDFIEFGNELSGFLVADVSGKSLPGMLVMLLTRDIVKRHARMISDPAELLAAVNEDLLQNIKKEMFVTMFFAVIDESSSKVTFASAGHNPLLTMSGADGTIELLKTKGFPLGMVKSPEFRSRIEKRELSLNPGDWLIQFTDGINEAKDRQGIEYGMDRFVETISRNSNAKPNDLITKIMESHRAFVKDAPQFDDITLLAMKWHGQTVPKTNTQEANTYEKR